MTARLFPTRNDLRRAHERPPAQVDPAAPRFSPARGASLAGSWLATSAVSPRISFHRPRRSCRGSTRLTFAASSRRAFSLASPPALHSPHIRRREPRAFSLFTPTRRSPSIRRREHSLPLLPRSARFPFTAAGREATSLHADAPSAPFPPPKPASHPLSPRCSACVPFTARPSPRDIVHLASSLPDRLRSIRSLASSTIRPLDAPPMCLIRSRPRIRQFLALPSRLRSTLAAVPTPRKCAFPSASRATSRRGAVSLRCRLAPMTPGQVHLARTRGVTMSGPAHAPRKSCRHDSLVSRIAGDTVQCIDWLSTGELR